MPRFCKKEEADLRNVRSRCDVDQVVFGIRIERVLSREARKLLVDFFEIPRIIELDFVKADLCLGRH